MDKFRVARQQMLQRTAPELLEMQANSFDFYFTKTVFYICCDTGSLCALAIRPFSETLAGNQRHDTNESIELGQDDGYIINSGDLRGCC